MSRFHERRKRRIVKRWPPLDPGCDLWWDYVARLGVSRESVELTLRIAAHDGPLTSIDPHRLLVGPAASPAEHVVSYMQLAYYVPDYASLMYVVHEWEAAGRSVKEWLVTAYAWMIDEGNERHREAALYSLWVDYFEVPKRAAFVFPRLWRQVLRRDELLAASGPVPWEHKRAAYQAAACDPALHAGLARGLVACFDDVCGDVDPVEARALFQSIVVEDDAVRAALESRIFEPTRWRVVGLVTVDESDPRWRKWVPEDAAPSFLVELVPLASARWVCRSELLHGDRWLGRLLHRSFPFDEDIRHHREAVPHDESRACRFRIEGYVAAVRAALGAVVDAWPPGLVPDDVRPPT